jgi:hypothetical protein
MTKKSKKHASADVGLMFTAFNLRRIMNIVDKNVFKKFLKELAFLFSEISTFVKVFTVKMSFSIFPTNRNISF